MSSIEAGTAVQTFSEEALRDMFEEAMIKADVMPEGDRWSDKDASGSYTSLVTQVSLDMFKAGVAAGVAAKSDAYEEEPSSDHGVHAEGITWYSTPDKEVFVRDAEGFLIRLYSKPAGEADTDPADGHEFDYAVATAKTIVAAMKRYASDLQADRQATPVPEVLFDHKAVYERVVQNSNQSRTSQENVADVLQAVTGIMVEAGYAFEQPGELLTERAIAVFDWAARTVRAVADQDRKVPLESSWWSQLVLVASALNNEVKRGSAP